MREFFRGGNVHSKSVLKWRPLQLESLEHRLLLTTELLGTLLPPDANGPQQNAEFGTSLAVSDQYRVVGAPQAAVDGIWRHGQVSIYDDSDQLIANIVNPDVSSPAINDGFGSAVAVSGETVVIAANQEDSGATNAGAVYVFDLALGAPVLIETLFNPDPTFVRSFGESIAIDGDTIVVGSQLISSSVNDRPTVFVYELVGASAQITGMIANPDVQSAQDERFGDAVAIHESTVVVGAPREDTGAASAGAAYVYDLSSGTPTLADTINNPQPSSGDSFGSAVAIDGNTVVIAAESDDAGAIAAGSVYVYDRSGGSSSLSDTIPNPTPTVGAGFGNSIGLEGNTVVIGAALDDSGASNSGSAYVYDVVSGMAVLQVPLSNPTTAANDYFGQTVAISGTTIFVGADQDDAGTTDAGFVHVFHVSDGIGTLTGELDNATPASGDAFGSDVAISESTIVIGSHLDDNGALDTGSAHVFRMDSGGPSLVTSLTSPSPMPGDEFGHAVAISGNMVVVGAPFDNWGGPRSGSAYVYEVGDDSATLIATISNPFPQIDDYFGWSVDISGDLVAIGAYQDDQAIVDVGRVFIYRIMGDEALFLTDIDNPTPDIGDRFGWSVAMSGTTVAVGAPHDDAGGENSSGSVHLFDVSTGTAALLETLSNPQPSPFATFGYDVSLDGQIVVVGANGDDTAAEDAGIAYAYDLSGESASLMAEIQNPTPTGGESFGRSVSISDTKVTVGAYGDDEGATNAGSAYLYDLDDVVPGSVLSAPLETLNNPAPNFGDRFGTAVAVSSSHTVVGANFDDTQNYDQGSAYVFGTPVSSPDFNQDGQLDCADINGLTNVIAAAIYDTTFDLNNDALVDATDLALWLEQAGEMNLGAGRAYQYGDANLSGDVDGADFLAWSAAKFTENANWCDGDFNASGVVDGQDFLLWNNNKFQSADLMATVTGIAAHRHTASSRFATASVASPADSESADNEFEEVSDRAVLALPSGDRWSAPTSRTHPTSQHASHDEFFRQVGSTINEVVSAPLFPPAA